MMKRCVRCGARLLSINVHYPGKVFCPNCGIIEENQEVDEENKKERSYIG